MVAEIMVKGHSFHDSHGFRAGAALNVAPIVDMLRKHKVFHSNGALRTVDVQCE